MGKTGTVTKATKKRKFVDLEFECDDATIKRLNKIADLAAVTLSQLVSVILALYINGIKEVNGDFTKAPKKASTGGEVTARDWQDPSMPIGMPEEWTMGKDKKIKKRTITRGIGLGDK